MSEVTKRNINALAESQAAMKQKIAEVEMNNKHLTNLVQTLMNKVRALETAYLMIQNRGSGPTT